MTSINMSHDIDERIQIFDDDRHYHQLDLIKYYRCRIQLFRNAFSVSNVFLHTILSLR